MASAGLQYQRVSGRDADGNLRKEGAIFDGSGKIISDKIPLTVSPSGEDDLLLLRLGIQRDLRNNPVQPTKGSFLSFGIDQSVPIGTGSVFMTRLRGNYSQYLPIKLISFSKKSETLATQMRVRHSFHFKKKQGLREFIFFFSCRNDNCKIAHSTHST